MLAALRATSAQLGFKLVADVSMQTLLQWQSKDCEEVLIIKRPKSGKKTSPTLDIY